MAAVGLKNTQAALQEASAALDSLRLPATIDAPQRKTLAAARAHLAELRKPLPSLDAWGALPPFAPLSLLPMAADAPDSSQLS